MANPESVFPVTGGASILRRLFTLRPHDTATESGRSMERYRRAALTSAATVIGRGVGMLATLVSVPLTIGYLGAERYGIWMTVTTVIALLGFSDLGLGNGLLNAISASHGRDDRYSARRAVSSAFFMLTGVALLLASAFAICYPSIPWDRVFNVSHEVGREEAGPAMAVFFGCFLVGLPLSVVNRIQTGYQQGFVSAAWQAVGSLLTLSLLLAAIWMRGSLPVLVLALAGAPVLATAINAGALFGRAMPWLLPTWSMADWQSAIQLSRAGFMFLILQICISLFSSVDNLIVAQVLGPAAVADLAVPSRLFAVAGGLAMFALLPLWPAYGEALARGDTAWAKRTVIRSTIFATTVTLLVATPLVLFGKPIVRAWVGQEVHPSFSLLLALGCWTVLAAMGTSMSMFLNAANVIALQVICAVAVGIASLLLKPQMGTVYGCAGIVWVTNISFTLFVIVPTICFLPMVIQRTNQGRPA